MTDENFKYLPGNDLFSLGLSDLQSGIISEKSILVLMAGPRLRRLGLEIPSLNVPRPYEHSLYSYLEERMGNRAYSHFNSLLKRMASLLHALEFES
jgi:hypothetical protein